MVTQRRHREYSLDDRLIKLLDVDVRCGGAPMIPVSEEPPGGLTISPDASKGTQIGKRYVNEAGDLELLCTKPGKGSLACDGVALAIKGAKPLPASD